MGRAATAPRGSRSSACTRRSSRSSATRGTWRARYATRGCATPSCRTTTSRTWDAYANRYWPAKYLIDAEGYVRYVHFGEGSYDETEGAIRTLLAEAGRERLGGTTDPRVERAMTTATPETYLGSARAERFVNGPLDRRPRGASRRRASSFRPTTSRSRAPGASRTTGHGRPRCAALPELQREARLPRARLARWRGASDARAAWTGGRSARSLSGASGSTGWWTCRGRAGTCSSCGPRPARAATRSRSASRLPRGRARRREISISAGRTPHDHPGRTGAPAQRCSSSSASSRDIAWR